MARWTASAKWAAGPALDGQRDMPLALRLSEGLGISACSRPTGLSLCARDCASRFALRQEQSRYSASAAHAKALHGAPRLASRTTEAALCLDCCAVPTRTAWVHFLLTPDARAEMSTSILIHFCSFLRSSCFRIFVDRGSYRRWVTSLCPVNRSNLRSRATKRRREVIRGSAALWLLNSRR